MADGDVEMGPVLPCGKVSNKLVPKKGKQKPDPPPKKPKTYKLKAKVRSGTTNIAGAKVVVDGATVNSNGSGLSDFGKKAAGAYKLTATFDAASDYLDITTAIDINLGADTEVPVEIKKKNIVSVKIEPEFKAIPLDRKLSDHQNVGEVKVVTGICYIKLTFEQSNTAHPYAKKATFTCTGAGAVDLFTDEACTVAFDGNIPNAQIVGGLPTKYYLKSKTAGKFDAKITFEDPADPKVKLKKAVEQEPMSVVEIELQVFMNDQDAIKNKKIVQDLHPISKYHANLKKFEIPDQKKMSDSDKVKKGRFLHLQKDNNNGRAKIILKINTTQWLDECLSYDLYLVPVCVTGSLDFYDAEEKGTKWDKTKPIKVTELAKKKGEKEFWVEGTGVTDKLLEAKLGITLNRPAKGPAHTEKKNADWARFTVVEITEVKLDYVQGGDPVKAWNATDKKFYINLKADDAGRKIKIKAKLGQKIAGVPLHFMLAGDKDNRKKATWGVDMPSTWKWDKMEAAIKQKDKTNRDDFLHLSKETDANGEADMELILPRIAGEKYTPACYIHEDPHLAKFIDGHTDLEKRKPKMCDHNMILWRRIWYQLTFADGFNPPKPVASEGAYTRVCVQFEQANEKKFTKANHAADKTFYPEWMVKTGGGAKEVAVIGAHNKANFFNTYFQNDSDVGKDPSIKELKAHVLLCEYQCDPHAKYTTDTRTFDMAANETGWVQFAVTNENDPMILSPCLNGATLVKKGTCTNIADPTKTEALTDANIILDSSRPGKMYAKIKLPGTMPATAGDKVRVTIKFNVACGFLGESDGKNIMAVFDSNDVPDYNDTITHEVGHSLAQSPTPAKKANGNAVKPRSIPLGLPIHPDTQDEGQGVHCYSSSTKNCVMWPSGIATCIHRYCDTCQPYLMVQDMSKLN